MLTYRLRSNGHFSSRWLFLLKISAIHRCAPRGTAGSASIITIPALHEGTFTCSLWDRMPINGIKYPTEVTCKPYGEIMPGHTRGLLRLGAHGRRLAVKP